MEQLFRWIRGFLICSLKGGDMERFFNLCRYQGIECWGMSYNEGICQCSLYLKDFLKIRPFVRKTRVRVRIRKRSGLVFFLAFLRQRKGLWMGMAGCIAILCFLSAHIWKIEIDGNSYYSEERLKKYLLEDENIQLGTWKGRIDNPVIEENLRLTFPDISWVSVRKEGTSLRISIEEMVKYDESETKKEFPRYICAAKSGEIVSMVTRSGIPRVHAGDEVTEGQLLIDGIMEIKNEAMEVAETLPVGADGDIWAKIRENYHEVYPFMEESRNYGRASQKVTLSIGDYHFSFGKNPYKDLSDKDYDRLTEFRDYWPGIRIQREFFRPYTTTPTWSSAAQMEERAQAQLQKIIQDFEEKGVQILENNVKILMYEDRVEAVGDFLLIEPLGEGTDHLPEGMHNEEMGETDEYNGDYD